MAHYFMHLRDSTKEVLDPDGRDFPTIEVLRDAMLFSARDVMSGDVRAGRLDLRFRIDAHDRTGAIVYTLPFRHALDVINEDDPSPSSLAPRRVRSS